MRPFYSGVVLSILSLLLASCGGNPTPTPPPDTPTANMQVVEFATAEATATPAPTNTQIPTLTPTSTAQSTVEVDEGISGPAEFNLTRPPDQNPLTGLKVDDQTLIQRRPLMVRLGNDAQARPQVGLNEADMVYEELVEWWITRFTAIYLSQDLEMIAPIRSMRLINLQLTPQYQGVLAHSGGSDPVRFMMSQTNIPNLDEFFVPDIYFYRDTNHWATRLALNALDTRQYLLDNNMENDVTLRGFVFNKNLVVDDLPEEAVAEARDVTIPYPPASGSEVRWTYDETSGRYLRFTNGEPVADAAGNRFSAANVVIYFAEHQVTDIVEDSTGATSVNIIINGFGTAWIIRDGYILKGNWESNGSQTPNFTFNNGTPIPLTPGNTWVQVVPLSYEIEIDGNYHARLGSIKKMDTGAGEPAGTGEPADTAKPAGTAEPADTPTPKKEPTAKITPTSKTTPTSKITPTAKITPTVQTTPTAKTTFTATPIGSRATATPTSE